MRAMAPHWEAHKASWGEAACIFERLSPPTFWLCELAGIMSDDGQPVPEPVIQLMTSNMATVLTAARFTVLKTDLTLPYRFFPLIDKQPAAISLFLPRIAEGSNSVQEASSTLFHASRAVDCMLVMSQCSNPEVCPLMVLGSCHAVTLINRTSAELLHCSKPGTARRAAHLAVGGLSCYAASLTTEITFRASQGYERAPSGSAQLRDLLARPLLQLLYSPLLDTLVALQHVMIEESFPGLQRDLESSARKSVYPLDDLRFRLSSPTDLDATDARVLMQVGHTYYSRAKWPCKWVTLITLGLFMAQLALPLVIPLPCHEAVGLYCSRRVIG